MLTTSKDHLARAGLALAIIALLPMAALHADPCDDLRSRTENRSVNLGSSFDLGVVANLGQLLDDAAYAAYGLAGNSFRFRQDGGVELAFADGGLATVRFGAGAPALGVLEDHGTTTRLVSASGTLELPRFGGLVASGLAEGLDAELRVRSRQLRARLSGDASGLAVTVDGVAEIRENPAGDFHELVLVGGRVLRLHAARYGDGGPEERVAFLESGGALRLSPKALANVPAGHALEVVLDVASWVHAYDAVADATGSTVALGTTVDARFASGDPAAGSGADVVLLRFDSEGAVAGATVLASSGDDLAVALSAAASGELVVAGLAGAEGLPFEGEAGFGVGEPFVARFGPDGALYSGRYLAQDGFAAIHDVAVDLDDQVLVSGRATAGAAGGDGLELTAVLPQAEGASSVRYLLAELDAELVPTGRRGAVEGEDSGIRLEVTPGCGGRPWVGPRPVAATATSCTGGLNTNTYTPTPRPTPAGSYQDGWVDLLFDAWGWHALRWKRISQPAAPWIYSPPPNAPFLIVQQNDHTQLNNLESDPFVFSSQPAGIWLSNTSFSPLETAIGAALYMDFWGSPSYLNLQLPSQSQARAVALMEVEFCVDPAFGQTTVVDYCAQTALGQGITAARYPIDEIDRLCGIQWGGAPFFLREVKIDRWDNPTFLQNVPLPRPTFEASLNAAINLNRWYIADPPDDSAAAPAFLGEVADRLSGEAEATVDTRMYEVEADGTVSFVESGEGAVSARAERSEEIR